MFKKREVIDEIDLGAELFLKGRKNSPRVQETQKTVIETPQQPQNS